MPAASASRLGFAALIAGATGIGFAPVLVRLADTGPSATAGWRMLFALPFLFVWARSRRETSETSSRPRTLRDYATLALAGLFFTGDLSIWHWSLQYTSVTNSTLITNFAPIFVMLGAWLFLAERIDSRVVVGMAVALGGGALLVRGDLQLSREHLRGDALALLAAVFYAGYLLTVKQLRNRFSTAIIMSGSGIVACAGFFAVAAVTGDAMAPTAGRGWMAVIALALVSHVGGQTLITYGLGHLPASFSAVSLLWQPVVAALVAWPVLGEPIRGLQLFGGLGVLAGIFLASRARR